MIKATLNVKRKIFLATNYLRIFFGGENVSLFRNVPAGANCKLAIAPADSEGVQVSRTYTFRGIDPANNELWIDFIVYAGMGPMTEWAKNSKTGDKVILVAREENPPLYMPSDWYLLAGDSVAIPMLSALLETLPETANGYCFINAADQGVEIPLTSRSNIQIEWMYGGGNELTKRIKGLAIPKGSKFGLVASELEVLREIRGYLRNEIQWDRTSLKALPFWKRGTTEDESSEERHSEVQF